MALSTTRESASNGRRARFRDSRILMSAPCSTSAAKATRSISSWSCSTARRSRSLIARGPVTMTGGASHRRRDRRGAGSSSESRDHPSRPEAGQRDVDALRGQASRLRIGQDARGGRLDSRDRTGNGSGADGARHVAGHGALHVARAVRGPPCRRAQRCLRARSCSLRDGNRCPRICRRHCRGHRVLHPAL